MSKKILRRIALFLSFVLLLTSTVNTAYGYLIAKSETLFNRFLPFDSVTNSLLITKQVEHPFGEDYRIPEELSFAFKVELGALYANTVLQTSAGAVRTDATGAFIASVIPGRGFAAEGIDAGTVVTVTELEKQGSGFAVKDGTVTRQQTVPQEGPACFDYVNTYTPAPVKPDNVTVEGTKLLQGRPWQNGDSFTFRLEQQVGSEQWISLGERTVSYTAQQQSFDRFDFTDAVQALTFDRVGTYRFRITELAGSLENVEYDDRISTFAIRVTDTDMDGKLEINSVSAEENAELTQGNGSYRITTQFRNEYVPVLPDPQDITVELAVKKTVENTGTAAIGPEGFAFVLENTVTGQKLTQRSDQNGSAVFRLPITAADAGKIFTYRLYETDEGMPGMRYDPKVYEASVAVSKNAQNQLVATLTLDGQPTSQPVAQFRNTYHGELSAPEPVRVELTAKKTVKNTGTTTMGPEGFTFVLENTQTGQKLTQKSRQDGKAVFALPFTAEDVGKTYSYTLREVDDGVAGVTYDTTVWRVKITVTLDQERKLVTAVTVNDSQTQTPVAEFENIYAGKSTQIPGTGDPNQTGLWFALMLISGTACAVLIVLERREAKALGRKAKESE